MDKDEIAEGRFFRINDVKEIVKNNKNCLTPSFLDEWKYLMKKGIV